MLLRGGLRRLRRRGQGRQTGGGRTGGRAEGADDGLLHAGQRLQQARLSRGLGLRQLADETRISTPVLEALERGWRERLPEAAYLRTMLPLLEEHLALQPGSLRQALPAERPRARAAGRGREGLWRFRPGAIDLFNSWQGSLLYGLLMGALLLALNRQQLLLAQRGLLNVEPLPPEAIPVNPVVVGAGPTGTAGQVITTESITIRQECGGTSRDGGSEPKRGLAPGRVSPGGRQGAIGRRALPKWLLRPGGHGCESLPLTPNVISRPAPPLL